MGPTVVTGAERRRHTISGAIVALRRSQRGRVALYLGAVALVAFSYYLAGRLGLELAYLDGAVAALWPPAGLGLAVLFLYGIRLWPGVVIGDLLLADFFDAAGTVLGQTVGNTLALVAAALLLTRLAGGRANLERTLDVLALVICAAVAALVSAAFGPPALRLGDVVTADEFGRVLRTWTLSDMSGVLVVAPVLLTWAATGLKGIRRRDVLEGAVGLAVLVALAELAPQRTCPTSCSRCSSGRRCDWALGVRQRRSSSSARSRCGTRPRRPGRSCVNRSPTACSPPSLYRDRGSHFARPRRGDRRAHPGRPGRWRPARRPNARWPMSTRPCGGWPRSSPRRRRRAACSRR